MMKKHCLSLFLLFSLFFTDLKPEDIVSNYLKEIGLHGIITKSLLAYGLYKNWKLCKIRCSKQLASSGIELSSKAAKEKYPNTSPTELLKKANQFRKEMTIKLACKGLPPDKYHIVNKELESVRFENNSSWFFNHIRYGEFVERLDRFDLKPILVYSYSTLESTFYHEAKHVLDALSRSYFWIQKGIPALSFVGASIFAASYKKESLTLPASLALYITPFLIEKYCSNQLWKYFEQKADDFIPNNIKLLTIEKERIEELANKRKALYLEDTTEKSSMGAFLCKQLLPHDAGFSLWETFIEDPRHPRCITRTKKLEKRIKNIQDGKVKEDDLTVDCPPPKPPLISDTFFKVIEATTAGYSLAAQGLHTALGAEKTLNIIAPITETLVQSLISKAFDAIQDKVSKKISILSKK